MSTTPVVPIPDGKEGLQFVHALGEQSLYQTIREIGGHSYHVTKTGAVLIPEFQPELPTPLQIHTLDGIKQLFETHFEAIKDEVDPEGLFVHVVAYNEVHVLDLKSDKFGRRRVLIKSTPIQVDGFAFNKYLTHEDFTISLLSKFQQPAKPEDDHLQYLLKISETVTGEAVVASENTGAGQMVSLRQGALVSAAKTELKQRVKLSPFRTFREIDQPRSEFIFRVNQPKPGEIPTLALIEADGGKWKLDAIQTIAEKLRADLQNVKVIS